MRRYLISRLLQLLVTLLVIAVVIFLLSRVLGDPTTFMLPLDATEEDVQRLRELLGLDQPLPAQFLLFLQGLLVGDLGFSVRLQQPVLQIIGDRLGASVLLAAVSVAWALMVSVALGTLAAMRQGTWADHAANLLAVIGQSAPSFWFGLLLIQLFAVQLQWLPASGTGTPYHLVLPAFTLGLVALAGLTRLVRSSMLEVLKADYITKARMMGLPESRVIFRHALPNAMLPVLTYAGELFAILIAAAVAVEVVFAWPGIGRLAFEAVFNRDHALVQGIVIVVAVFVMGVNLIVDLLYALIDPRIRYAK